MPPLSAGRVRATTRDWALIICGSTHQCCCADCRASTACKVQQPNKLLLKCLPAMLPLSAGRVRATTRDWAVVICGPTHQRCCVDCRATMACKVQQLSRLSLKPLQISRPLCCWQIRGNRLRVGCCGSTHQRCCVDCRATMACKVQQLSRLSLKPLRIARPLCCWQIQGNKLRVGWCYPWHPSWELTPSWIGPTPDGCIYMSDRLCEACSSFSRYTILLAVSPFGRC